MSNNDVVYYNLTIGNNDPQEAGILTYDSIPSNIDAKNNLPIIQNPDDYYASIIRFTLPALNIPLITFLVQTEQPNINLGVYSFTICSGLNPNANPPILTPTTTSGRVFVEFVPQVIFPSSKTPPSPVGIFQSVSPYYLLYDYEHFIKMWNTALKTAHNNLYSTDPNPPYFYYTQSTQLISLFTQLSYVGY